MKLIIFQIFVVLFLLTSNSWAQILHTDESYKFPKLDGLMSTMAAATIGTPGGATWLNLKLYPINRYVDGDLAYVKVRLYPPKSHCHPEAKSLVFLQVGIGSGASVPIANFYANELAKDCHYTLIMPSIFHKHFIRGVSNTGVIGEARSDMRDLYDFMKYTTDYLKINKGLHFDSYSLMGYSLGALSSAFLAKLDHIERDFNFKKILIINPPVDLQYSMGVIDTYSSNLRRWRKFRKYKELARLGKNILIFRKYIPNDVSFKKFARRHSHLSTFEKKAVVGKALSDVLPGAIKYGQQCMYAIRGVNLGLRSHKGYTFRSYINNIFIPFRQQFENDSFIDTFTHNSDNSLYALEDFLKNKTNLYIMHNEDDFLLKKEHFTYLIELFQDRLILYPRGGHMGNIWWHQNIEDMKNIMRI